MIVLRAAVAAAAIGMAGACGGETCGEGLPGTRHALENSRYALTFVTLPDPAPTDGHFAVHVAVCPRNGAPMPKSVRIDATMPEHRHGMNYRPSVTSPRPGAYRAEGLLFHMRGRWDVTFDLATGSGTERLTGTLRVE